ncbi:putative hexokinase [Leptomonas pyrrhocoris]|uniref:Phosphotransferase n=1 Tax=Leptomonas pyrrhocoris TaxID=157538 RepID=A0A0M9FXJ7_LEPPY|nr:putative hexokinase [Leptomonas pyrrhocoris]XP_015656575.1 putative hexokinase [Leptomonas pyrrhocoris]KPA78135.1 putative hexokinase [Leptomonas pyrrhocoris]KPA78136.1 putative hexokinase [Leptomonas pyrrhocoris]|eukprot:XP_015656574.1 putative hexokinase [Leptomonas pyrrhocoris]
MASRVNNLLSHIAIRDSDSDEMRYVKQRLALASLASQFTMSQEKMKQITMYMIHEMVEGLEGRESTIRMLPSYVYTSNPNKATGVYYALDLGGTNFRVLRVSLRHGKVDARIDSKFVIPKAALTGTATDLFDFIAQSVKKMMLEKAPEDMENRVPLGFTFSFPCDQKSVNKGLLIKWTKGFSTKGVEGQDVVELLQTSLRRVKINVNVVALCNDTVGTLVARYFVDTDVQVGVIIGTGSNACYFERASAVTKDPTVAAHGNAMTPINMECGNFDSKYKFVLPITQYDEDMDQLTPNRENQRQEKIVAGMYLGEVARRIIVHLAKIGCLPRELHDGLSKMWSFESKHLGMIAADQMPGLQFTRLLLQKISGVDVTDVSDLHTVREACCLVRNRAAQQGAIFSAAPMLKTHTQGLGTIAVDGSVYEKMPSFQRLYQENISRLLGKMSNAKAVLQKDGSGIGAAMICALVVNEQKKN